jgi:hypothetical protein
MPAPSSQPLPSAESATLNVGRPSSRQEEKEAGTPGCRQSAPRLRWNGAPVEQLRYGFGADDVAFEIMGRLAQALEETAMHPFPSLLFNQLE